MAIDEKVSLMEATEAEDVINQPFAVQQNPTATAVVTRQRLVERFSEVQLVEEVAERTLALKKTRQKMKKKNQQLVESRHEYEDRLRQQRQQQQQALQQAREDNERLNGLLQLERRSKQALEEILDQMLQKLYSNLFIQAQRAECTVCLVEEVQVLFLPCRHLVTPGKCANRLNQCPTLRNTFRTQ